MSISGFTTNAYIGLTKVVQLVPDKLHDRCEMSGGTVNPIDAARRIEQGITFSKLDINWDAAFIRNKAGALATDNSRIVIVGAQTRDC